MKKMLKVVLIALMITCLGTPVFAEGSAGGSKDTTTGTGQITVRYTAVSMLMLIIFITKRRILL